MNCRIHLSGPAFTVGIGLLALCVTIGESAERKGPEADALPAWTESAVPIPGYQPSDLPADLSPTRTQQGEAPVKVYGEPRDVTAHPCTLWDGQDAEEMRKRIAQDPKAQASFAVLKRRCDSQIAKALPVPPAAAVKDPRTFYRAHEGNSTSICDLGILFQLTGDPRYGEYARKMLVAFGTNYPRYPHPDGWTKKRYRSALDGRISGQFLNDGFILARLAVGYDLVHDLPSWTSDERTAVHDGLLVGIASEFYDPVLNKGGYIDTFDNRSCICNSALLMAGYASDDSRLINMGLYGIDGDAQHPTGGVFGTHFTPNCILPDGLWVEGSPSYQLQIAGSGLFNDAQTLWHHGINLYAYRNGILKHLLDSALLLAYPNEKLAVAALHDAGRFELLDSRGWMSSELSIGYEIGYLRYRDPAYLPIIRNAAQDLGMTIHAGPISLFPEVPDGGSAPPRNIASENFFSTGFGVLRLNTDQGPSQVLMEFGPPAGHGHPSKLGIDVYALGDTLIPFPGVIFPYDNPLDPKWFWTSLGNAELTVDESNQIYSANMYKFRKFPSPQAFQSVFAPAQTLAMQRAWSNTVFPGVTQDRALFFTPEYLADTFAAFSKSPHRYDLAWHFLGTGQTSLALAPMTFPVPVRNGYNALSNVRHATTDGAWSATIATHANKTARLLAAASPKAEVITADGPHFGAKGSEKDNDQLVILQRHDGSSDVIDGNVVDISNQRDGYVKGVATEGGLQQGYAITHIDTARGADLCFVSFRPGRYAVAGLETDAVQAMVLRDGAAIRSMYLAGGTFLKTPGGEIRRGDPGLLCIERLPAGGYNLSNPSPTPARVSVTLDGVVAPLDQQMSGGARLQIGTK